MRLLTLLVLIAAPLHAYEATTDSTAYRIALWKDGDWRTEKLVTGRHDQLDAEGRATHAECRVQVKKEPSPEGLRWTIEVTPEAGWGVAEVDYPMLVLPRLPEDHLVFGKRIGQRVPMSVLTRRGDRLPELSQRSEMAAMPDLFNKKAIFFERYPTLTLQMIAYENEGEGVMLWTPDAEGWIKDFVVSMDDLDPQTRGHGYRAYVVHLPERTGQPGTAFHSPYPVITTSYRGGWHEAALVYKKWADAQKWSAAGRIDDRPHTPPWFAKVQTAYGIAGGTGYAAGKLDAASKFLGAERPLWVQYMNYSRWFDAGTVAAPEFLPPAEPEAFDRLLQRQTEGRYVAPYFIFSGLVPQHEEAYARHRAALIQAVDGSVPAMFFPATSVHYERMDSGQLPPAAGRMLREFTSWQAEVRKAWSGPLDEALLARLKTFPQPADALRGQQARLREQWGRDAALVEQTKIFFPFDRACLGHTPYLDYCAREARRLLQEHHSPIVYLDTFPHAAIPCYNPAHSHPPGYGRHILGGSRALCARIMTETPSAIIACESGTAEPLLDVAQLTFFKGLTGVQYAIPLFPAVYGGLVEYSAWWMWPPYDTPESFASSLAVSVHLGYQIGSSITGGVLAQLLEMPDSPEKTQMTTFLQHSVDARARWRRYLCGGERWPDLQVDGCAEETQSWSGGRGSGITQVRLRPVLASRWRHAGKDLILLSNHSRVAQDIRVAGIAVHLGPLSWHGIELKTAPEDDAKRFASHAASFMRPVLTPGTTGDELIATGFLTRADATTGLLTIEWTVLENGHRISRQREFRYDAKTPVQNLPEATPSLVPGLKAHITYPAAAQPGNTPPRALRIDIDPKGRKEDEG